RAGAVLAIAGAVAAAWFGYPLGGFAALAFAVLAIELGDGIAQLTRPSFAGEAPPSLLSRGLRLAHDAALVAVGTLALPGALHRRAFLALLPVGLLHLWPPAAPDSWRALFADRLLAIVALALAVGFDAAEKGFMAVALVLLAVRIWPPAGKRD